MWESIMKLVKRVKRKPNKQAINSKDAAKERLHLVLMQDRANVSADFLELMKQEIIEVIKKYIEIDETAIDVRLTNKENNDGTNGAPALYANIPIVNIKDEVRQRSRTNNIENIEIEESKVPQKQKEEVKQERVKTDKPQEIEIENVTKRERQKNKEVKKESKKDEEKATKKEEKEVRTKEKIATQKAVTQVQK